MNALDILVLTGIPMSHPMLDAFYGGDGTGIMLERDAWNRASRAGAFNANPMHLRRTFRGAYTGG